MYPGLQPTVIEVVDVVIFVFGLPPDLYVLAAPEKTPNGILSGACGEIKT